MTDFTLFLNPRHGPPGVVTLPAAGFRRAKAEITSWDGYAPTPLRDLPLPGTVRLKDKSTRFGLGSFKALGGAYAVANLLANELARTGVAPAAGSADLPAARSPMPRAASPSPPPPTGTTAVPSPGPRRGFIAAA